MGFNDKGLIEMGSFLKGDSPTPPDYIEFGAGSMNFTGSTPNLQSGFYRAPITWRWNGNKPVAIAQLGTNAAVGSNIQELGLAVGASVGSNLYTRDLSAIGDKTNSFTVEVSQEIRLSRP